MKITSIELLPISYPIPQANAVTLGVGRAIKRDAVLLKVYTDEGLVGWGEAHHGRCPGAVAKLIDTTLSELVIGMDPFDVVSVWAKVYKMQLASHGLGAAASMALSGLDIALWDIRGKATGWPIYRLLGGSAKRIRAYAGGISLGWQPPASLVEEAGGYIADGYTALKLRVGDTVTRDIERVEAVRKAYPEIEILVDANTGYTLDDARKAMPALAALGVGWLEEPFASQDYRSYIQAKNFGAVPLAAGENHFTRFDFTRIIEDGAIQILQPDLSKAGGITETLRIAALASAWKLPVHAHTSATGINMAATAHFMAAIENAGLYEGDVARDNPFRTEVAEAAYMTDVKGRIGPLDGPGLGLNINEDYIRKHPLIEGPCYV